MGILGRLLSGKKAASANRAPGSTARADEHIVRGQQLEDSGDFAGAEAAFREAIACAPGYPRAHINLGNALHKQSRLADAARAHREAVRLEPGYAPAHFNLGMVLLALGDSAGAREHLESVLALSPAMADAQVLLAQACEAQGDPAAAQAHLEAALAIDPGLCGAAANLGTLHADAGRLTQARAAFETALGVDRHCVPAISGMGRVAMMQGHAVEAATRFEQAVQLDPANSETWSSYLFALNFRDDVDASAIAGEHFRFGAAFDRPPAPLPAPAIGHRRLRLGYVSGDFMKHPVALFLRPVLHAHDREAFEVFGYSNGARADELTAQLRGLVDHWRPVGGQSDDALAELIRRDGIDILVDMSGHTAHNRLGAFARRAAPVQATWLGYLNTTGLAAMDYRICDAWTDPPGTTEALNRETLMRMPHSQWCYAPYYDVPVAPEATAHTSLTFGAFNQLAKVGEACLDAWCEVLRALPMAQLRVHSVPSGAEEDLLARFERRGIERARVSLVGRLGIFDYFAAIAQVDLALDAFPYNGATTTLDTLWMGIPVVALRGARPISRGSYSIAAAAGLEELIASSPQDFVERNVALGRDPAGRAALRRSLRARLAASPVMDAQRFTRDLESLYREMREGARG